MSKPTFGDSIQLPGIAGYWEIIDARDVESTRDDYRQVAVLRAPRIEIGRVVREDVEVKIRRHPRGPFQAVKQFDLTPKALLVWNAAILPVDEGTLLDLPDLTGEDITRLAIGRTGMGVPEQRRRRDQVPFIEDLTVEQRARVLEAWTEAYRIEAAKILGLPR